MTKEPFIKVGARVQRIGNSKYRYENWPTDKWLEAGVCGTVIEYLAESPAVRVAGEYYEPLPAYAVVQWDLGDTAKACIDSDDENIGWKRL